MQLYQVNNQKKEYDIILFQKFLRNIWLTYAYRISEYKIRNITLMFSDKNTSIYTMPLSFILKFMIKTVIKL